MEEGCELLSDSLRNRCEPLSVRDGTAPDEGRAGHSPETPPRHTGGKEACAHGDSVKFLQIRRLFRPHSPRAGHRSKPQRTGRKLVRKEGGFIICKMRSSPRKHHLFIFVIHKGLAGRCVNVLKTYSDEDVFILPATETTSKSQCGGHKWLLFAHSFSREAILGNVWRSWGGLPGSEPQFLH